MPEVPRLRRLREAKLISQEELAKRSGVNVTTISRLESGRTTARFSTIHKLAGALGVDPQELVAREYEE